MNKTYLRLIGCALLGASVFHVGKIALAEFPPLVVATWRYGIAAIILFGMTLPDIRSHWKQIKEHAVLLLILSVVGVGGFAIFLFYGLNLTSPINASLIIAFNPALIMLLSALFNRERINLQQMTGLLLGIAGVVTVISHASLTALIHLSLSKGDLMIILAILCWSAYSILPKRYLSGIPTVLLTSITVVISALFMFGFTAYTTPQLFHMPGTGMLFVMLFLGLFGTVIPYIWWNQALQTIGPAKAGVFLNLVPIFTSLMGILLGQHLEASQICGAALVIFGVIITSVKINKTKQPKPNELAVCT